MRAPRVCEWCQGLSADVGSDVLGGAGGGLVWVSSTHARAPHVRPCCSLAPRSLPDLVHRCSGTGTLHVRQHARHVAWREAGRGLLASCVALYARHGVALGRVWAAYFMCGTVCKAWRGLRQGVGCLLHLRHSLRRAVQREAGFFAHRWHQACRFTPLVE